VLGYSLGASFGVSTQCTTGIWVMADFKQHLRTDKFSLIQTKRSHFEPLYQVASDPLIWEQHPAQDRWRREIFSAFFEEGLSNDLGCFTIVDSQPQNVIGSTRFYAHDPQNASVRLGYTFLSRNYWGTGANALIKTALLDHSFQYVESIYFDIGETNWRSIKATEKLGAVFCQKAEEGKSEYLLSRAAFLSRRPSLVSV
jgi:RimJ/RimL family protein N-acetyltransferase